MKRLTFLCFLTVTTSSFALSGGTFGFGVHANYANLNVAEPLKSAYGPGFGGGLHGDLRFGNVTLRVNGDYISFGADHDVYTTLVYNAIVVEYPDILRQDIKVDGGGTIGILSFGANGKYSLPNVKVSPYLIGGIGVAKTSISEISATLQGAPVTILTDFTSKASFMTNVGAGIDFPLGSTAIFLELKYTWIFIEGQTTTYFPISLGVTF
jgi:hypothetical protein